MHLHPFLSPSLSLSLRLLKSSLGKYLPARFIFISFVCYFLLSLSVFLTLLLFPSVYCPFFLPLALYLLWLALPLFVVIFIVHFTFYILHAACSFLALECVFLFIRASSYCESCYPCRSALFFGGCPGLFVGS